MIKQYLHLFNINGVPDKWIPIENGYINTSAILECQADNKRISYFVQKVNTSIFRNPDQIGKNIQNVQQLLQQNAYQYTPLELVLTKKKERGQWIGGDYWRMFRGIENGFTPSKVHTPQQAYQAAKAFSHFSKCLLQRDAKPIVAAIPDFHDFNQRVLAFQKAIHVDVASRVRVCQSEINWIRERLPLVQQFLNINSPQRLVHGDPKIGNLLFSKENQEVIAVVDWDTIMLSSILIEYGDMVRSIGSSADENESDLTKVYLDSSHLEAIKKGFLEEWEEELEENEIAHLELASRVVILIQAIRFLTDFLEKDIYYITSYKEHNLIRAQNQISLLSNT